MATNLRSRLIRLAHSNPELRSHLLPIITAARKTYGDWTVEGPSTTRPEGRGVERRAVLYGNNELRIEVDSIHEDFEHTVIVSVRDPIDGDSVTVSGRGDTDDPKRIVDTLTNLLEREFRDRIVDHERGLDRALGRAEARVAEAEQALASAKKQLVEAKQFAEESTEPRFELDAMIDAAASFPKNWTEVS